MSDERKSDEELLLDQKNVDYLLFKGPAGGLWRHKRLGTEYVVWFAAYEEATCRSVVVYWPRAGGVKWTRPLEEFLDRFEPVLPTDPIGSQT